MYIFAFSYLFSRDILKANVFKVLRLKIRRGNTVVVDSLTPSS